MLFRSNLAKLVQDAQEDKKEVYKEINEPIKISNDLVNKDDIGAQKNVLVDIISEDDEPEEKFERENNNLLSSILNAEGEGEELQCELPKNELPLLDNDFKENNDIKENDIKENDIKENDIKENDIKDNDIKGNDIKKNDIKENLKINYKLGEVSIVIEPKVSYSNILAKARD